MASKEPVTSSQEKLAKGISQFSLSLYKQCGENETNVFISPYSVTAALLLANLGAKGETEREIRSALGLSSIQQENIHREYRALQEKLDESADGTAAFSVANRMFAKLDLEVLKQFEAESELHYGSGIESLDFIGNPDESCATINKWVETKTEGKIKDLLSPGAISADTLMIIVNAIYFKGQWVDPFEWDLTKKEDFHLSSTEKIPVDMMMNNEAKIKYLKDEALGCSAVELPYKSAGMTMVVILPDKTEGLKSLEEKLSGDVLFNFCKVLDSKMGSDVILGLPKFRVESKFNLTHTLSKLGIQSMTNRSKADFGRMLKNPDGAYISDVMHKTFVQVDEYGTEAICAMYMKCTCDCLVIGPKPPRFIADHPFIFLIRDTFTGTVLFLGRFASPVGTAVPSRRGGIETDMD